MRMRDKKMMHCTFDKAQYLLGQDVRIRLPGGAVPAEVAVYRLEQAVPCDWRAEDGELVLPAPSCGCYGVSVKAGQGVWEGAFDVVEDHRQVIRYGFLTDFSTQDAGGGAVEWMCGLHLNAVQFYDWMYRHDRLLPPKTRYEDPMGRSTDLDVIAKKIELCRRRGMRPFAYGAVYAATRDTFREHPEWGMYTMDGEPMTFAGWLYYMNIAPECGWSGHLAGEYRKAIAFGFAGIHMDTYGFPKHVWDGQGRPLELAEEFPKLIARAAETVRREDPDGGVIFNAVNNWPVEAVADAAQDAVYIEVWPPNDTYFDLYALIRQARLRSGRNVVLAAYLKPFQLEDVPAAERAFRLAWAVICASGGTQLVLGEKQGVLRDSYYVNYATFRPEFLPVVQNYCDFLVRYGDLLYNDQGTDVSRTAAGGINEDVCFSSDTAGFSSGGEADRVWTILRESKQRLTVHLINLQGNDGRWNEPKAEPARTGGIRIHFRLDRPVKGFYCASPDAQSLRAAELPYAVRNTAQGRIYDVEVPEVRYWTAVWAQLEG